MALTQKISIPIQAQVPTLKFANFFMQMHNYWKTKVRQVHASWEIVTDKVEVDKLDVRSLSIEIFENQKMPRFKLGSRVKIVGKDIRTFKMLHKTIGIWNEKMLEAIGKEAIVMNLTSVFVIKVSRVDNGKMVLIHGCALEIVTDEIADGIWENKTDFELNDDVVIGVDNQTLGFLQQTVQKTPFNRAIQFIGLIARIVAFYEDKVIVTFDEMTHELFHPDALRVYAEAQSKNKKKLDKRHSAKSENLAISTQVKLGTKIVDVMFRQNDHGGWQYQMTKFLGKSGIVADTLKGGDVIVQFTTLEGYRMNPLNVDVVKTEKNKRKRTKSESSTLRPFAVGDVVRLNMSAMDLISHLHILHIPLSFATIVSSTAEFVGYADLRNGVIDYGDGTHLILELRMLVKVKDSIMSDNHRKLKQSDNDIGVGKEVVLWIGPRSFAKTCVKNFKDSFEKTFNDIAIIQGYDKNGSAVIKYQNDAELYSVPGEYLCSPRPIWNRDDDVVLFTNWENGPVRVPTTVSSVETKILQAVSDVLEIDDESSTKWTSTITEDPHRNDYRRIRITILLAVKNCEVFLDNMKKKLRFYKFEVSSSGDNGIAVKANQQIYSMHFYFNASTSQTEQQSIDQETRFSGSLTPEILERHLSITEDVIDDEHVNTDVSDTPLKQDASLIPETESDSQSRERIEKSGIPNNLAVPYGSACTINVPAGIRQLVIQFDEKMASTALPSKSSTEQSIDVGHLFNIVGNPVINQTVNMNLVGENEVDVDKSVVRKMTIRN